MANRLIKIERISGALGAVITGVDLKRPLDDATIAEIRAAWLEHLVVFFRDQDLTPAEFLAFAQRFGALDEYPFVKGIEGFPQIIQVAKLEHERVNFGGIWHSDTTYLERPPMGAMLLAREVPPVGGDTLFANMYLAYDALSSGMKRLLDGLVGVSSSAKADVSRTREDRIKDMSEEESAGLLQYLFQHQVRPEFTCRFAWKPGSMAFWDNRAAQHNPINDYHGQRRIMHRISLAGDVPR